MKKSSGKKKILLIDTFNFLHRAYHALPKTLRDKEGNPTNAIYGVTSMLINIFDVIKPDYAIAALDSKEPTFRVEEFTGYKAHRKPMEDDLSVQIDKLFEIIDSFGVKRITVDGYEADDVIGTVVDKVPDDVEVIIASNDRDMWQLVGDNVVLMLPSTKGQAEWLGEAEVEKRLGFDPDNLVDYKGLKGDSSDNIPGVYGVGDKTARNLIGKYKTIENIYKNIDEIESKSLREKLLNNYEEALMSKKLGTIITDVPFEFNLEDCKYTEFNKGEVKKELEKYNFKSLIKRLGFEADGRRKRKVEESENQVSLFGSGGQ